jgi:archaellin
MNVRALFLIIACFVIAGCGDERKPIPVLNIRVLADGNFQLNKQLMTAAQVRDEVQRVADENRHSIGSGARVQVRVATQAGASQADKRMVINACIAAGINSIEQSAADE